MSSTRREKPKLNKTIKRKTKRINWGGKIGQRKMNGNNINEKREIKKK